MQPTIEILDRIRKNSRDNKEEIFTRLYRYLLRPDLYYLAYKNLYANKGAGTKGVNDDTADGFSKEKVDRIIQSLADGTYTPNPVRRKYIQKKQNSTKKRPLGIPTFTDKLVQEVLRMILESVYEPIFSNNSHGFRPNRSCHTALKSLKREFSGVSWFIEGDIKGCFDNIDHQVLANVINAKIKDARLIQLIWKFLKAGYMEDWQYHATYSGCPQGGIVSPILANIYLNELDKFVEKTAKEFYKSRDRHHTPEYDKVTWQIKKAQKQLKTATGQEKTALLQKIAQLKAVMHKTPCIAEYAKHDRAEFVRVVQEAQSSQQTAEVRKQRTRLATAKQRVSELEVLLCKIYEDNILGKLSDSRYATLDAQYEKEQSELTSEISVLEKAVKSYEKHEKDADRFIALIGKYENFDKLTIAMLNEFIEKILVHERDRKGSIQTTQEVEIYFNFVGRFVPPAFGEVELTPEELEEIRKREERKDRLHQNYLKRKASGAQKRYEDKIKERKKAEIEAKKAAIRAEDIAKGVFVPVSSLPQREPMKGVQSA